MAANATASNLYDYLFVDLADPRTSSWFLMQGPTPVLIIVAIYLYFVKSLGPRLMKNRKPFKLQKTIMFYNYFQIIFSLWIFIEALDAGWLRKYSWRCQPIDWSYSPEALRVARDVHIYFIGKIIELLDTVFFVLRKKDSQITFLHLYHHAGMVLFTWGGTKYLPGGHTTFIGLVNSLVHFIMYTYYLLAGLGPEYQKYLWWKRYITVMQLVQFAAGFIHNGQLLFYDCGFPRWTVFLTIPNAIIFYYLFLDFYRKAYSKKDKVTSSGSEERAAQVQDNKEPIKTD